MSKFKVSFLLIFSLLIFSCKKEVATKNEIPKINAGSNRSVILPGLTTVDTLNLNGIATDADGQVVSYIWSQVSGPNTPTIQNPGSAITMVSGIIAGTYIFQLIATDNDGATGVGSVKFIVLPPVIKQLILGQGTLDAQQSIVSTRDANPAVANNINTNTDILAAAWTYSSSNGTDRTYLKFAGLSAIPSTSVIVSAYLSLYGFDPNQAVASPQGNSYYSGSPWFSSGSNIGWLKRASADWNSSTITWNNKPATTDVDQVAVAESNAAWNYNVIDLDVTKLVKVMVNNNQNFGFSLQLQTEQAYRSLTFSGSLSSKISYRPKLVINYK